MVADSKNSFQWKLQKLISMQAFFFCSETGFQALGHIFEGFIFKKSSFTTNSHKKSSKNSEPKNFLWFWKMK